MIQQIIAVSRKGILCCLDKDSEVFILKDDNIGVAVYGRCFASVIPLDG